MFGHVASSTPTRGEYFLFYSYAIFSGGPLLIALVSGEAAYHFEEISAAEATSRVMQVLRSIFEPKGINVPSPLQVSLFTIAFAYKVIQDSRTHHWLGLGEVLGKV